MNWDYIAGLVDGEGCIGLYIYDERTRLAFLPRIEIAGRTERLLIVKTFLENEGLNVSTSTAHGTIVALTISKWESIRIFCEKIGELILKEEELSLMKKVIYLHFSLPESNGGKDLKSHQKELIELAIALQSYKSNKGKKKSDYTMYRDRFV